MCTYLGALKPLSQVEILGDTIDEPEDVLEINSRDFLASLQRLMTLKYQEFSSRETNKNSDTSTMSTSPNTFKNNEDYKNFNNF